MIEILKTQQATTTVTDEPKAFYQTMRAALPHISAEEAVSIFAEVRTGIINQGANWIASRDNGKFTFTRFNDGTEV